MNQHTLWKEIKHPQIKPGYYINEIGEVYHENSPDVITKADYHATNGYDFILLCDNTALEQPRLFPIDDLMAMTFIPIPDELKDKRVKVSHINGDTRDNLLDNLQWVEDIEEWRVCTYPGVKPDTYEVSSWGRIRNIEKDLVYSSASVNSRGYTTTTLLSINGRVKSVTFHKMVAYHFLSNPNDYKEINHIDCVKTHNWVKNLEWCTHQMNMDHMNKNNLVSHPKGSDIAHALLNEEIVEDICKEFIRFWGRSESVYKYMKHKCNTLTLKQIQHIKHKECWQHISDKYWTKKDLEILEIKKIHLICEAIVKFSGDLQKML